MLKPKWFYPSYKKDVGEWAWILHRLGGLALIFYLFLHIFVTNRLAAGPEAFNATMKALSTPLFKFLEWGLWGVILFHAFNGIRLVFCRGFQVPKSSFLDSLCSISGSLDTGSMEILYLRR